jgi:uncharacterized protein (TIGR02145 family)
VVESSSSALSSSSVASSGTFTDNRDGTTYKYVTIGSQVWMAENLNYSSGATICKDPYGCYYTWEVANSVCPGGWHLPSDDEWTKLIKFAGTSSAKQFLPTNVGGTNSYGFSALFGGFYEGTRCYYGIVGCFLWSSTEYDDSIGQSMAFHRYINNTCSDKCEWERAASYQFQSLNIRCVKD